MSDNELADRLERYSSTEDERIAAARIRQLNVLNAKWDVLLAERIAEIAELRGEVERLRTECVTAYGKGWDDGVIDLAEGLCRSQGEKPEHSE